MMMSGHMWLQIRGAPYTMQNQDGTVVRYVFPTSCIQTINFPVIYFQVVYLMVFPWYCLQSVFSGSSQFQLGAESHAVILLYGLTAAGIVLINEKAIPAKDGTPTQFCVT